MHVLWSQGCRRREKVHAQRAGGRASCHVSVAAVDQRALDGAAVAAGQELLAQARHTLHLQLALTTMTGPCRGVCSAATLEWQQVQQGIAAAGHLAPNSTCTCGFDKYLERARLLEAARAPPPHPVPAAAQTQPAQDAKVRAPHVVGFYHVSTGTRLCLCLRRACLQASLHFCTPACLPWPSWTAPCTSKAWRHGCTVCEAGWARSG
jgi:hypothetical protein